MLSQNRSINDIKLIPCCGLICSGVLFSLLINFFHAHLSFERIPASSPGKRTPTPNGIKVVGRIQGSISVSGQLPTYPSPNSTTVNWRAQSKNNPLIFRPFLKVSTCQNSTTLEHFQTSPKNQGIVLALSPPIDNKLRLMLG